MPTLYVHGIPPSHFDHFLDQCPNRLPYLNQKVCIAGDRYQVTQILIGNHSWNITLTKI